MKRLTDSTFKYVSAAATDIRKTFARARREQAETARREAQNAAEAAQKVAPIPTTKRKV